jgi:hypothetical protein
MWAGMAMACLLGAAACADQPLQSARELQPRALSIIDAATTTPAELTWYPTIEACNIQYDCHPTLKIEVAVRDSTTAVIALASTPAFEADPDVTVTDFPTLMVGPQAGAGQTLRFRLLQNTSGETWVVCSQVVITPDPSGYSAFPFPESLTCPKHPTTTRLATFAVNYTFGS